MTKKEKNFLKIIEENNGFYDASDSELANTLDVKIYSVAKYKRDLKDLGYIQIKSKFIDGKRRCFYKLLKSYNPEDDKKIEW